MNPNVLEDINYASSQEYTSILGSDVINDLNTSILDYLNEYSYSGGYVPRIIPPIPPVPPIPPGPIPCFLEGTKILTEHGEKLIETLKKGMNIIGHKGEKIKIFNIYSFKIHKNEDTHPCLITKGTIINGHKCNDNLYISREHAILIDNVFIPIGKIMQSQVVEDNNAYYSYYHLITENYFTDVVIANGILTESYVSAMKQLMNIHLYDYLIKFTNKNGNRILLSKSNFIRLVKKYYTLKNIKQIKHTI